jgi:hypothetical protein
MPVTFTATVTTTGTTPTGKVTFRSGRSLGTGTLSNGVATFTTSPTQLAAGNNSITASYAGDSTHAASNSPIFSQTVDKATTSASLASSPNPSGTNQAVTFTATIAAPAGLPVPTGRVQFKKGNTILGTVVLTNGTAALNYTFTKTGSYTIEANYQGNADYLSSSGSIVQVVQ